MRKIVLDVRVQDEEDGREKDEKKDGVRCDGVLVN